MIEEVAVIDEGADDVRVAEIHPQTYARVSEPPAVVEGDVDRIAQKRLVHLKSGPFAQLEMHLVDMEIVQLHRAVLDDPILHVPLLDDDLRDVRSRIKPHRCLAIQRDVEVPGALEIGRIRCEEIGNNRLFEKEWPP